MKKEKIQTMLKAKSFYIGIFLLVFGLLAASGIYMNSTKKEEQNLVDLNEPLLESVKEDSSVIKPETITGQIETNILPNSKTDILSNAQASAIPATPEATGKPEQTEPTNTTTEEKEETDKIGEKEDAQTLETSENPVQDTTKENEITSQIVVEQPTEEVDTGTPVMSNAIEESLSFNAESGLIWPITGNVLMNYSKDHVIYFETLEQYRYNPAILIEGTVGDIVVAAAKGIVTEVRDDSETGKTVVTSIGDNYSITYGQLKDITVSVGDVVEEGAVFATLEEPSKYYIEEGCNLYLKVEQNGEPVNPLLVLK